MKGRSKPSYIADALARDEIHVVRAYGRKGGLKTAEKRKRSAKTKKVIDDEEDLYAQVLEDPTIVRKTRAVDQEQGNEEYYFGGHL